jgi:Rac GTPase-activating protein 1
MGTIADYTPHTAPMVPSLIVHCINEVEVRGLNEVGIYRVPGLEKDVKALKV